MKKLRKLIRLIRSNQKVQVIILISTVAVMLICGIALTMIPHIDKKNSVSASASDISGSDFTYITPTIENSDDVTDVPEPVVDEEVTSFVPATKMDLDPTSITVYINKEYALPKDYKPDNLVTPNIRFDILTYDERTLLRSEAAKAIEKLFATAENDGYYLSGVSGYRSYQRQYKIFTNNIVTQGKAHTLQYSAVPGTSEHQTGLSIDVSTESLNNKLSEEFSDSPEGIWLAKNSYKYGFIIRYPKDKADITGYAYEPWHIRYVGRGLSYYLHNNKLTLDEYYNYSPSPNFNFEELYADIINYVAPSIMIPVTPSITPTSGAITEMPGKDIQPGDDTPGVSNVPTPTPKSTSTPKPTSAPNPSPGVTVTNVPTDDNTGSTTGNNDGTTNGSIHQE